MAKLVVLAVAIAIAAQLIILPATNLAAQEATQTTEIVIPDGTEITVVTTDEISSKTATEGDPLNFRVAEDIVINGKVVIAKDSLVKGTVASAKKSGFMGRGGNLGIRVESAMTVDNQKLKLRSAKNKEGGDKTGTTVALVVLFGPLGFLKKGKNAIIKSGTPIKAFTDEEKKVQPKV
jgi:hypothetical protein